MYSQSQARKARHTITSVNAYLQGLVRREPTPANVEAYKLVIEAARAVRAELVKPGRRRRVNIGSVSTGTMRPEDLIPAFIDELRAQQPLSQPIRRELRDIERSMSRADYFEAADTSEDLNYLFDALNTFAPEGFYFGAHPGDGADYGFWLSDDFIEDFDGLKVSDLSDVPRAYSGSVLLVNDHGNTSLYRYTNGRGRECWSIV